MNGKRLTLTTIAIMALLHVTAVAQGRSMRSPEERAKQLKEQLTLSDEQTAKVQKIYEDGQKKMMEMRETNMGDRETMRKAFIEMAAKQDSLIAQLLTKEQVVKYEALKKERQQRMQQFQRGQ